MLSMFNLFHVWSVVIYIDVYQCIFVIIRISIFFRDSNYRCVPCMKLERCLPQRHMSIILKPLCPLYYFIYINLYQLLMIRWALLTLFRFGWQFFRLIALSQADRRCLLFGCSCNLTGLLNLPPRPESFC